MTIGTSIQKAAEALRSDQLVAIPTETVYGLAGNALSEETVVKIFSVKNRPFFDPLIVHLGHIEQLSEFTRSVPELAYDLANTFWPGPMTLLLPKKEIIPDLVTAGNERVAVRIPQHPLTQKLLQSINFPLAAPSANPFGYISPTTAQHVADQLGSQLLYILDGGACQVGLESTIIGLENEELVIYRKGGLPVEQLRHFSDKIRIMEHSSSNPKSPGQLKSHYAPKIPLMLGDIREMYPQHKGKKIGLISFFEDFADLDIQKHFRLSPQKDMKQAAKQLFSSMRLLDNESLDVILAEVLPEKGLGRAINDRLRRAAAH